MNSSDEIVGGIAVGAISCGVAFVLEKALRRFGVDIDLHWAFYAGLFTGNFLWHAVLRSKLGL